MPSSLLLLLIACTTPAPEAPPPAPPPAPVVEPAPPEPPPPPTPRDFLNPVPEGFEDLCVDHTGITCAIAYHTAENFTGAPLPGYGAPAAWMLLEPAAAVQRVADTLAEQGLGLLIYDAYRPVRGTLSMVAWARRSGNEALLHGYIASRSGHNHGHTVDLTLADLATGEPLDLGCPFDTLDERAHTRNAEGEVLAHRLLLVEAMKAEGFKNYSKEWWHYSTKLEGTSPRDVPYGCFEPAEGAWTPPEGWDRPGYVPPAEWSPTPCPEP
ncbi:MAG: M15 family metallopeptidase [Pseudomonadota bacterium]